ncbi:DUF1840 domain-containing protein [Thiocapsa rosea]|uniref:Uncharacterized protein DUF1840 n=1 Tax=Thiocapsa rosea TaxID=69360 RepID=A0A495VAV2_9GAMM|nr:DUF1840 domain-containing protein [Thiocapsa rosea]RKT46414.1 uncharacterized protein DUF1840 [Thiocapsa rosea]
MLVTFRTKAYADITMFGDVAVTLLKLMGHSGAVPGALMPEDIPAALTKLKAAVEEHAETPLDPTPSGSQAAPRDGKDGQYVSLAHRALPLIELLTAAAADDAYVMWD